MLTSTPTAQGTPAAVPDPGWWTAGLASHERTGTDPVRPAWAEIAEHVIATATPAAALPSPWRAAFARVLRPFTAIAGERVAAACDPATTVGNTVSDAVAESLSELLVDLAARTLVAELGSATNLPGPDGAARFAAFVREHTTAAGLGALLTRYPVLARLLGQATAGTADAAVELLARLRADRAELVDRLLDGRDPGPVVALRPGLGDRHDHGRTVTSVVFADGRRLLYKPRDLTALAVLARFLAPLEHTVPGLASAVPATVTRPGYGWSAYVAADELADAAGGDRFYRRLGGLLAVLHVLRATDLHHENVIAAGDQPALVDLETLLHPDLTPAGASGDPAAEGLARSVHRTALLPLMAVGEGGVADVSGLGGGDGGLSPATVVGWADAGTDRMRLVRRPARMTHSANRPRLDGRVLDPADHEDALVAGFRAVYRAIAADRDRWARSVAGAADLPVRVVVRPTWTYRTLLDETTHPDVLRDALDRDRAFAVLDTATPVRAALREAEIAALWRGDVPLFATTAGGTLAGPLDRPTGVPARLARSGVDAAADAIAALGEVDRRDQEWIIAASLATRAGADPHHRAAALAGEPAGVAAHQDALVAAACRVADELVALGFPGVGRVNWLGLAPADRQWLVLPLDAGLGNGHLGVALFLAQLAEHTGIDRYLTTARRAAAAAPPLLARLGDHPELVAAVGCGAHAGFGGIAYALARLSRQLDDPALRAAAEDAVRLAGVAAAANPDPAWVTGLAGCVSAMRSVYVDLGLPAAAELAGASADRLADAVGRAAFDTRCDGGFAHGLGGIAWALAGTGVHPAAAARAAELAGERVPTGTGWCCGPEGTALATGATELSAGLRADLSLAHGELGRLEVLLAADPAGTGQRLRRHAGLVLGVLRTAGPLCGTPRGVPTPGLLTGLAGIGHGLLRLADPAAVPSSLLVAPTERAVPPGRPGQPGPAYTQ